MPVFTGMKLWGKRSPVGKKVFGSHTIVNFVYVQVAIMEVISVLNSQEKILDSNPAAHF